jgi:peptide chain release factor subunit 3
MSGFTGDNIKNRVDPKTCGWYKGPTMLEIFDTLELPERNPNGPIRIPVMDRMKDRGIVVFGKVESGTINMGEKLTLSPNNINC